MANLIFPVDFDEKCTIAQDDYILFSDSEDNDKIKKAKYCHLKWETWTAATITVGSTSTWCAWTCACVTNSGTCSAAVFDFTIPQWAKWDTWCTWASICDASFSWNDIVFQKDNGCTVTLCDAKICLQWPQGCTWATWNGICCTILNPDYTLTLQYTNGCCDTTWSIRWPQWETGCQWPTGCTWPTGNWICCTTLNPDYTLTIQYDNGCCDTTGSIRWEQWPQGCTWCTWATWNWICCTTSSKAWKTTTVELQYTDWSCFDFCVQDWQDGCGAWDMLACVYDPNNCAKDAFDYNNLENRYAYWEWCGTASAKTKCVCIPEVKTLCTGQEIVVKTNVANTACATCLQLNNFTAYEIKYNNASLTSTNDSYVWWENTLTHFLFDGTNWQVVATSYDANTTYTMNNSVDGWQYTAGSGTYAISRYSLVMEKDNGTWEKITATNATYSTWTSKSVNTNWFKLGHIRYHSGSSNFANGALITANVFSNKAASVAGSYSFNCGTAPWWTVWTYIYLVGSMWNDWLFYLDTTQWWATQLPSAKDGKLYIRLWLTLKADDSTFSFLEDRPIYYYDNWIKVYWQADNKQDVANMVTTLTWADNDHYPTALAVSCAIPSVVDNLTSTSTTSALSANQWCVLKWYIDDLSAFWKFLSLWDASTWQPISFPLETPYTYSTWDYFMVETIDTWATPTNYKPNGSSYTGTASSTTESGEIKVWDYYVYDGTVWLLASNHGKDVSFANITWNVSDNAALNTALWNKANDNAVVKLSWNQTVAWTKTFSTSPVVPSKTADATNTWTEIATEAQVYKKQDKHTVLTLTLASNWWSSKTQTVSATWVTSSNTVIISPAPTSLDDYSNNKIYCSAQWTNSLTFTCTTEPTSAITVNVIILN